MKTEEVKEKVPEIVTKYVPLVIVKSLLIHACVTFHLSCSSFWIEL